jgi:ElaB/YqjD/DUF883 family membrane-anchored ribosome-binding protein
MSNGNNLANKAQNTEKDLAAQGDNLKETIKEKAINAGSAIEEKVRDIGQDAIDKTSNAMEHVCQYIKSHPYKAVGIAFLVGSLCAFKLSGIGKNHSS